MKMAENGAISPVPCLFLSIQLTDRLGTLGLLKKRYKLLTFYRPLILDKVYETDVENALVLLVICMKD